MANTFLPVQSYIKRPFRARKQWSFSTTNNGGIELLEGIRLTGSFNAATAPTASADFYKETLFESIEFLYYEKQFKEFQQTVGNEILNNPNLVHNYTASKGVRNSGYTAGGFDDWVDTDNNGVPDDYVQPAFATGQSGSYRSAENGFSDRFFRLDENGDAQIAVEANNPVGWTAGSFYRLKGKYRAKTDTDIFYFRNNLSQAFPYSNSPKNGAPDLNPLPQNTGSATDFEIRFRATGTNERLQIRIDGTGGDGRWYEIDELQLDEFAIPSWTLINSPVAVFPASSSFGGLSSPLYCYFEQNDGIRQLGVTLTSGSIYRLRAKIYKLDTRTTRFYVYDSDNGTVRLNKDFTSAGLVEIDELFTVPTSSTAYAQVTNASSGDSELYIDEYSITEVLNVSTSIDNITPTRTFYNYFGVLDYSFRDIKDSCKVLNIPQRYYGDGISPTTFKLEDTVQGKYIVDDGWGNLYDLANSSSFAVSKSDYTIGNIIYAHGVAIITNTSSLYSSFGDGGWILTFNGDHTITEHEVTCKVDPGQLNYTLNPSIFSQSVVGGVTYTSDNYRMDIIDSTGFAPYVTTIGMYNEDGEMVAVAKLPNAIRNDEFLSLNFVVRFDT